MTYCMLSSLSFYTHVIFIYVSCSTYGWTPPGNRRLSNIRPDSSAGVLWGSASLAVGMMEAGGASDALLQSLAENWGPPRLSKSRLWMTRLWLNNAMNLSSHDLLGMVYHGVSWVIIVYIYQLLKIQLTKGWFTQFFYSQLQEATRSLNMIQRNPRIWIDVQIIASIPISNPGEMQTEFK